MPLQIDQHRSYLSDRLRIRLYRKAIHQVVRSGDVVLDLGAGTGILGLLACEAGAKRVYSVEASDLVELAREIAAANGYGARMVGVRGMSTRIDLPEKVDVLIADQIGHFGIEAGVVEYFRDAKIRLLKPGGRTLPRSLTLELAPVSFPEMWKRIDFWSDSPAGLNFAPARVIAANSFYPIEYRTSQFLAPPARLLTLDLNSITPRTFGAEVAIKVKRAGTMHGISGWFVAELARGVTMTNSSLAKHHVNRRNVFFPLEQPVKVAKGDSVQIAMNITPRPTTITWRVRVTDRVGAERAKFIQSTLKGMLVSRETLMQTRPDFVPVLDRHGEARRTIVDLCDGRRTSAEIESEVLRRYPDLFATPTDAAEFILEVIGAHVSVLVARSDGGC
jgi:protein arginine N-methyltransferase 1